MPDPTPQEEQKPAPKPKEEGKSLFARLFKKKESTIPEGARPVELPKPAEAKAASQPAPHLSPVVPPVASVPEKKSESSSEMAKEKAKPTPLPVESPKTEELGEKKAPAKLFRSLELFKKDREERLGTSAAAKASEPKVEAPKFPVQPPVIPSKVEIKKADEPKKEEPSKLEPKVPIVPPPLIPATVKKVDPSVPSSIFISKPVPPVSVPEKPKEMTSPEKTAEVPKVPPLPTTVPDAEKNKDSDKEKKDEGKATIQKMEAGQPRKRRGRAIVDIPPSGRQEERTVGLFSKRIILIMGAILLSFGVFSLYFLLRETRLQVSITPAEGIELSPQVYVVYDFEDRAEMIRRNLSARRAPVRELLDDSLASLNAAQADYSGKAQRKKMLQENILKDQAEIPAMLNRTRGELNALWDKESKKLDQEYAAARDEFTKGIEDKAKSLGLKYNPNPELNEPEVAVNAFRLSLYGAPKGVDVTAQRKWAEDLLNGWREKEKVWVERRQKIRKEAEELRAPVGGMIEEIKKRAEFLQSQIAEVDEELALIQNEVNGFQDRVASFQKEMEDLIQPFYEELRRIPDDYKKTIYTLTGNKLDIRDMEKTKDMPPGRYKLLVRGVKDGQEQWALVNFEIKQYKNNQVEVQPSDFKPARKLIE